MNKHWTAEQNNNYIGGRLSGWIIRYDPTPDGGEKRADGSTVFSLNFPAFALTDIVSNPEAVAQLIAAELNSHANLLAALKLAQVIIGHPDDEGSKIIAAAIAAAEA